MLLSVHQEIKSGGIHMAKNVDFMWNLSAGTVLRGSQPQSLGDVLWERYCFPLYSAGDSYYFRRQFIGKLNVWMKDIFPFSHIRIWLVIPKRKNLEPL